MTNSTDPADIDLSPEASLIFWILLAFVAFADAGFCAGVLYAVY